MCRRRLLVSLCEAGASRNCRVITEIVHEPAMRFGGEYHFNVFTIGDNGLAKPYLLGTYTHCFSIVYDI